MSKECGSPCARTGSLDRDTNRRMMISGVGNKKFASGTSHPQCESCVAEDLLEMNRQLYPEETKLNEEFKKAMEKFEKLSRK